MSDTCDLTKYGDGFIGTTVCACGQRKSNSEAGWFCPGGHKTWTVRVVADPIAECIAMQAALDRAEADKVAAVEAMREACANVKIYIDGIGASSLPQRWETAIRTLPTPAPMTVAQAARVLLDAWDKGQIPEVIKQDFRDGFIMGALAALDKGAAT